MFNVDELNQRFGRDTVHFGLFTTDGKWRMKLSSRSPRYTTRWNELPKIYQAMIQACAREAGAWMTAKYDVLNPQAVKRLVASGAELRPFPQPVMEACYNSANEIYAELAQSNAHFKRMLDSLTAFRSDSYQWMQVAELAFDSFMMRMRTRA